MAGTLPGAQLARRRFHLSGGVSGYNLGIRHPSYCLYAHDHLETHPFSGTSLDWSDTRAGNNEKLGHLAEKAKERLDERLRELRRNNSDLIEESMRYKKGRAMNIMDLKTEVFGSKKMKKFTCTKLCRKPWEQEECIVCLDQFEVGDILLKLPCAHKIHSKCLVPWLEMSSSTTIC